MNLDELQSVRDRERQSDSLQQLRETFYEDAGDLVRELRAERDAVADRVDDPFDSTEVNRLSDDIKTAEQTVEAIYERRVGKLVKMASFAAADMPTDDEGLTAEERELFEYLVDAIEHNRDHVFGILDGEGGPSSPVPDVGTGEATSSTPARGDADPAHATGEADPAPAPSPQPGAEAPADESGADDGVDAADLMAGDAPDENDDQPVPPASEPDSGSEPESTPEREAGGPAAGTETTSGEDSPASELGLDPTPDEVAGEAVAPGSGSDRQTETTSDVSPDVPADDRQTGTAGETAPDAPAGDRPAETAAEPSTGESGAVASDTETPAGGTSDTGTSDAAASASAEAGRDETVTISRETVMITEEVGEIYGVDDRSYHLSSEDVVTLPSEHAEVLVEQDQAQRLD